MADKDGLNKLLDIPFFQHIKTDLEYEDIEQILTIIGEDIYPNANSFEAADIAKAVLEDNVRKETIGSQAERAKERLYAVVRDPEKKLLPFDGDSELLQKFLSEDNFQSCVFQLLDSLVRNMQNQLPDNKLFPSFEERVKAVARDNSEEFEDEIERAEAARESAERAQKAAEEARNTAESIIPNMLTTLGVFIAIVIAVVGCYLSVLLSHHTKNAETLDMGMILLMGHILMNIIFLLLYLISKMSVHSLACHCFEGNQMDCLKCSADLRKKCRLRHKLWLRYPYVVVMNSTFVVAYYALGLWHLIKRYFGSFIDQLLKNNLMYAVGMVVVAAVLFVAAGICVFRFFLCSPRRRVDVAEKKAESKEVKKRKAGEERKNIRKLQDELEAQKKRIITLESSLQVFIEKVEKYESEKEQEENDAPV